jgi:hypothetical protein
MAAGRKREIKYLLRKIPLTPIAMTIWNTIHRREASLSYLSAFSLSMPPVRLFLPLGAFILWCFCSTAICLPVSPRGDAATFATLMFVVVLIRVVLLG